MWGRTLFLGLMLAVAPVAAALAYSAPYATPYADVWGSHRWISAGENPDPGGVTYDTYEAYPDCCDDPARRLASEVSGEVAMGVGGNNPLQPGALRLYAQITEWSRWDSVHASGRLGDTFTAHDRADPGNRGPAVGLHAAVNILGTFEIHETPGGSSLGAAIQIWPIAGFYPGVSQVSLNWNWVDGIYELNSNIPGIDSIPQATNVETVGGALLFPVSVDYGTPFDFGFTVSVYVHRPAGVPWDWPVESVRAHFGQTFEIDFISTEPGVDLLVTGSGGYSNVPGPVPLPASLALLAPALAGVLILAGKRATADKTRFHAR